MSEHSRAIAGAVGSAVLGLVIGWTGHSFTLDGRVVAIEHTLQRIESRLDGIAAAGVRQ